MIKLMPFKVTDINQQLGRGRLRLEALNLVRDFGIAARKDLQNTTKTWKRPAHFNIVNKKVNNNTFSITVTTDDKLWIMLNRGVPREFRSKAGVTIIGAFGYSFPRYNVYQAKTTPGVLNSFAGQKGIVGKSMVFTQTVDWPGITARRWTQTFYKKWSQIFLERVVLFINNYMDETGHLFYTKKSAISLSIDIRRSMESYAREEEAFYE